MRASLVVVVLALMGCRAHPKVGRRILVADTQAGRTCFEEKQADYQQCMFHRVRHGLCLTTRDRALMACPGARDTTGEPDPTVVQLPGFQP